MAEEIPTSNATAAEDQESKTSKDILNELFSSFNTSFDESEELKKKHKKSKDKKSKKKKSHEGSDSSGEETKCGKVKKRKRHSSSDDVDAELKKFRKQKSLKKKVKDDKRTSKSKKKSKSSNSTCDVEDGEILDEEERKATHRHKKSKGYNKYELDEDEFLLLGYKPKSSSSSRRSLSPEKVHPSTSSSSRHSSRSYRRRSNEDYEYENDRFDSTSSSRTPRGRHKSVGEGSTRRDYNEHCSRDRHSYKDNYDFRNTNNRNNNNYNALRRAPPRERGRSRSRSPATKSTVSYFTSYHEKWQREKEKYREESAYYHDSSRDRPRNYDTEPVDSSTRRYAGSRTGFGFQDRYDETIAETRNSGRRDHNRNRSYNRRGSRRSRSWSRSRSRSRERNPEDVIDKPRLLEIARKNAAKLMKNGCMPTDIFSTDQIVAIRAGGKSVEELTDYCKKLAEKDALGDACDFSDGSDDDDGSTFIHHPFVVKERPMPQITLNIRNATPLPVRTPQELAIANVVLKGVFPVSSGTQHRIKELEWKPVEKDEEGKTETR